MEPRFRYRVGLGTVHKKYQSSPVVYKIMMMLLNKLLIIVLLNFTVDSFANAACYVVYNASGEMIHRSLDSPVDLSDNLQPQIEYKFGYRSHMVIDNAMPLIDCKEMNLRIFATEKARLQEIKKARLLMDQNDEKVRRNIALAKKEEEIRVYIENKFVEKRDREYYRVLMDTSGGNYKSELEEKFKSKVMDNLKDPDSAKFKNLKVIGYGQALCGLVNAKNSFGGYVGYKRFVSDDSGAYIEAESTRADDWERFKANTFYLKKAASYGCS